MHEDRISLLYGKMVLAPGFFVCCIVRKHIHGFWEGQLSGQDRYGGCRGDNLVIYTDIRERGLYHGLPCGQQYPADH